MASDGNPPPYTEYVPEIPQEVEKDHPDISPQIIRPPKIITPASVEWWRRQIEEKTGASRSDLMEMPFTDLKRYARSYGITFPYDPGDLDILTYQIDYIRMEKLVRHPMGNKKYFKVYDINKIIEVSQLRIEPIKHRDAYDLLEEIHDWVKQSGCWNSNSYIIEYEKFYNGENTLTGYFEFRLIKYTSK